MPLHAVRLLRAAAAAVVGNASIVSLAAAEASFAPGGTPGSAVEASPDPLVIPALVLAVALLALVVLVRRPSGRARAGIGVLLGVLGILFGAVLVLAGLMGDLSGQHRISVPVVVAGLAFAGVAVYGIRRVTRAPARSASGDPTG